MLIREFTWDDYPAVIALWTEVFGGIKPEDERPALTRTRAGELPPEGIVLGAVQVPADGQPLIFLADHPTTGGYPVIGVVADVTPLAQARPGTTVRFRAID